MKQILPHYTPSHTERRAMQTSRGSWLVDPFDVLEDRTLEIFKDGGVTLVRAGALLTQKMWRPRLPLRLWIIVLMGAWRCVFVWAVRNWWRCGKARTLVHGVCFPRLACLRVRIARSGISLERAQGQSLRNPSRPRRRQRPCPLC